MARVTSTNYTAAGEVFEYASADTDPILPEDIWLIAKAFHNHTHESTRGAAVRRIETASAPGSAGQVQISSDNLRWWGTGSSAIFTAASLTGAETFTNKTLVTPIIASFTNAQHNHSNAAAGGALDGAAITTGITGTGNVVKATSPTITTPTITAPTMTTPVVSSGGIAITGNSTITGTLDGLTGLTVASGGITVTGNSTIAGTLSSLTGLTLASGQVLLPVGSAANPSLYFDSGNGLYSAGTDRLNFATAGVVRAEISAAGNVGVGATPEAWHAAKRAIRIGLNGALSSYTTITRTELTDNSYESATDTWLALQTAPATRVRLSGGGFSIATAPSNTAGLAHTFTDRFSIAPDFSDTISLQAAAMVPGGNGTVSLGLTAQRYSQVWCTAGAFNSSSVTEKEHFTLLDPRDALEAVRATDLYAFEYRVMPGYRQAGFLAEQAHPLLSPDGASANAQSTASVALGAIQALLARVEALEAERR